MTGHRRHRGRWRILAPAALGWAVTAAVLPAQGAGRWVWICAGAAGIVVVVLSAGGRRGASFMRAAAVSCAALLLLGVRIDLAEHARAAPEFARAASSGSSVSCDGRLAGYPEARASPVGETQWVRAVCDTSRGGVEMLLWLSEPAAEGWAPGVRVAATGRPAPMPATSGAAYGISVRAIQVREPVSLRERAGAISAGLRTRLRDSAQRVGGAELVPGFAVGDTSLVTADLDRAMKASSLSHLIAVSGVIVVSGGA